MLYLGGGLSSTFLLPPVLYTRRFTSANPPPTPPGRFLRREVESSRPPCATFFGPQAGPPRDPLPGEPSTPLPSLHRYPVTHQLVVEYYAYRAQIAPRPGPTA
jgi:hypothetical protein